MPFAGGLTASKCCLVLEPELKSTHRQSPLPSPRRCGAVPTLEQILASSPGLSHPMLSVILGSRVKSPVPQFTHHVSNNTRPWAFHGTKQLIHSFVGL